MVEPLSHCPTCGSAGTSMTSLYDARWRYMCFDDDCPDRGRTWEGGFISELAKERGLSELKRLQEQAKKEGKEE